uniref:Uncharacterized protein n=1 Tax=Trichobilharzia regenti TaxID=157069 RepID=A0AA85ISV6_TRIRE|nr:unnamed protein product [Trichobilharzia regenti]
MGIISELHQPDGTSSDSQTLPSTSVNRDSFKTVYNSVLASSSSVTTEDKASQVTYLLLRKSTHTYRFLCTLLLGLLLAEKQCLLIGCFPAEGYSIISLLPSLR